MHQHGALAYQQTTKVVETPRDREASLLMKAALGLQKVREGWPVGTDELRSALTFNRKLWSIFTASVSSEDNPLPAPVRQNIANLGLFVFNETREITLAPDARRLDTLININRQLAAGLRTR